MDKTSKRERVALSATILQQLDKQSEATAAYIFEATEVENDLTITTLKQRTHLFLGLFHLRGVEPSFKVHDHAVILFTYR